MQTTDDAAPDVTAATPATGTPETAHEPAQTSTAPGTGQPAAVPAEPQQQPKNDWVQRRIDQLTREKHEERRQREALESRLRELQPPPATPATGSAPAPLTADQIREEARRMVEQEKFDAACTRVFEAGKAEYGADWDQSLATLGLVGNMSNEFLDAVTSMEAGHKVLQHLGQNPDAAERLLSLPPLRMVLELARLESTVGQAKTLPPVSQAPAPINPVGGRSAPVEPEEYATTADYIAARKRARNNRS
ncbi:hypothetical protein [Burkholderia gladioli]|uniref:hypothetical protein n=1 Tax=Burkholderia gladioli TaxID=28095 RepID=UPI0016406356|nr:hypothetical protein [Burkholderia gladioli]